MKIRFISYLTIVLAALLLGACNSIMDDEVCADQPSNTTTPVQIGFTLTTGDVSSRAITEGEEAGTGYENYIDIEGGDFRILLFDATDDTYLTTFEPTSIRPTDNTEYPQTYYVEGELSETYDNNFKLVVLANWGNYPELSAASTIKSVCNDAASIFTYTAPFTPSATQRIPMYGVKLCTETLRPDLLTDLGQVDLLRAMAKIEVTCSAEGFKLSKVKLHRYNTSGYCAPTGVDEDTATDWEYEENAVCNHATHIPANSVSTSELNFVISTENGFIAYVPEFDNKTNTEERSYIEVSLIHTDDKSPVNLEETNIYFCLYDEENGTPTVNSDFDIVRNHWYKYDITNVDDGELIFQYRVMKWNVESSAIGWNATATLAAWNSDNPKEPNLTDATVGDEEAVLCYVANPRYNSDRDGLVEGKSSYAGFYFQLKEPKGAVWKAHLSDPNFRFGTGKYDFEGTDDKFCASTGIAREEPYQIQIMAPYSWTEGTEFNGNLTAWGREHEGQEIKTKFWITISLDGVNEYPLIINPVIEDLKTHYNTGRRFAGENDYEIVLWQLKALGSPYNDFIDLLEYYNYNEWWNN